MKRMGFVIAIIASMQAHARDVTQRDLDSLFAQQVSTGRMMGLSVGIIQNGKVKTYHFGKTSATGTQATDETKYELASVTKLMTGTLIGFALNEGLFRESDKAQSYLPDLVLPTKEQVEITIRDLSTHRAGFDNTFWQRILIVDPLRPWAQFDKAALIQYLGQEPLAFVPGQNSNYDNIGTGIAGLILQNLYKISYDDLLAQKIFKPLGMTESGFYHSETNDATLAASYVFDSGALHEVPPWHQRTYLQGLGGLHSNMSDMLKFVHGVMETSDSSLASAFKTAMTQRLPSLAYPNETLGLLWRYRPEFNVYWHNGATYGMNSFLAVNSEKKAAVILLCNTGMAGELTNAGFAISSLLNSEN